jgi:HlyD family secretion protein
MASSSLFLLSCSNGDEDYDATGSFEAMEVIVSSQATGRILELNVNEGSSCKRAGWSAG